ncbi:hypothetical protein V8C86DRAFT_1553836 [Haematococcus lacustris]
MFGALQRHVGMTPYHHRELGSARYNPTLYNCYASTTPPCLNVCKPSGLVYMLACAADIARFNHSSLNASFYASGTALRNDIIPAKLGSHLLATATPLPTSTTRPSSLCHNLLVCHLPALAHLLPISQLIRSHRGTAMEHVVPCWMSYDGLQWHGPPHPSPHHLCRHSRSVGQDTGCESKETARQVRLRVTITAQCMVACACLNMLAHGMEHGMPA